MGWLIAHHATERRRADDRACRLRAQRQRHHHISHGRCRATGGAAWRMRHIVRIGSFAGGEHGEFGGHRLAENDGPCGTQQRHAGCVPGRSVPRVYRRAIAGGHVRGVNKVLDANRHAMQGALCRATITRPRLCQGCLGVKIFPGSHALFPRHDPFETGVHQRLAGDGASRYRLGSLHDGQLMQGFHTHLHSSAELPYMLAHHTQRERAIRARRALARPQQSALPVSAPPTGLWE